MGDSRIARGTNAIRHIVVIATILAGAALSRAATSPIIEFQPSPQATILGGRARFSVIASGDEPLSYQWRRNNVDLADGGKVSGATSRVLTLNGVRDEDAADYSVAVSNASGSTNSVDAALSLTVPQGGDVDVSFGVGSAIDSRVAAMAVQPDGRIIIGGSFGNVHGARKYRVARLNADGSTDHSFDAGQIGLIGSTFGVQAVAVQPDGRVLIGGDFFDPDPNGARRLARLALDGSRDASFMNGLSGASDSVLAIVPLQDGKILIAGKFLAINGSSRGRIARLNSDGSLDATFMNGLSGANGSVTCMAVQADGRVLIGGSFTTVNGVGRAGVARLNADGSVDPTFLNGLSGTSGVNAVALRPDGRVLIGGSFTSVNGVVRRRVARLNADGSLDPSFDFNTIFISGATVLALAVQPDEKVWVGGQLAVVDSVVRDQLLRLDANGSIDNSIPANRSFNNLSVTTLALRPDGRLLAGGDFNTLFGTNRRCIARIEANGTVDPTFLNGPSGANATVTAIAVQPGGRLVIGGVFETINGMTRPNLVRLEPDGTTDGTFLAGRRGPNGGPRTIVVQADGRILVGGFFNSMNGVDLPYLARLNPEGSEDATFLHGMGGPNDSVASVLVQPDGRILVAGEFTTMNGVVRGHLARLNPDGSLDGTFLDGLAGPNAVVYAVALQPNGCLLVGGAFTSFNGVNRKFLARVNVDGSLDSTFSQGLVGPNATVDLIAVQGDGHILIGGHFTSVDDVSRNGIARLNADGSLDPTFLADPAGLGNDINALVAQPDGHVLIGGQFTQVNGVERNYLARLNDDGSLDEEFLQGLVGPDAAVQAIALQADGRIVAGGVFRLCNDEVGERLVRLHGSPPVPAIITNQPMRASTHRGSCAVFRVGATGTPLDYEWRKDGVPLMDGERVSGARSAQILIGDVTGADEGTYSVVVENVLGDLTSMTATLAIVDMPQCKVAICDPSIGSVLVHAVDGTACNDGNACTTSDACSAGACVGASALPSEPAGLLVGSATKDDLAWSAATNAASYDVLRGRLGELPVGPGLGEETCVGNVVAPTVTDTFVPAVGDGAWYLVRGRNACNVGGDYGNQGIHGSTGLARISTTCP